MGARLTTTRDLMARLLITKNENIHHAQTETPLQIQRLPTKWRVSEAGNDGSIGSSLRLLWRW
jgi:hypothetical protein